MSETLKYRNAREQIAHHLTGSVCGQCRCSSHLGWSKPEMQPKCDCYEIAGEVIEIANRKAAAELSRLQQRNAELERALKPFADEAAHWDGDAPNRRNLYGRTADGEIEPTTLTLGDLRRARSRLSQPEKGTG